MGRIARSPDRRSLDGIGNESRRHPKLLGQSVLDVYLIKRYRMGLLPLERFP